MLEQVARSASEDPDELLEIARQYPISSAAADAALQAGIAHQNSGDSQAARSAWRFGLRLEPDRAQRGRLLGRLLTSLETTGHTEEVFRLLREVEGAHPELRIESGGDPPRAVSAWRRAFIDRLNPAERYPSIGDFADAEVRAIAGDQLLLPAHGRPAATAALVRVGREIRAYGGSGLELLWTQPIDRAETELLAIHNGSALLWGAERGFPLYAQRLSLTTGESIWKSNIWGLDDVGDDGQSLGEAARRRGRRIGRIPPALGPHEILFAITSGDVVCVDQESGDIRWTERGALPEITHLAAGPFGIVLAGHRDLNADESAIVVLLDPETGERLARFDLPASGRVEWLVTDEAGSAIVNTNEYTICYDLRRREQRWKLEGARASLGRDPLLFGSHIYVTDADESLTRIDIESGRAEQLSEINLEEAQRGSLRLTPWRGLAMIKASNGLYLFNGRGEPVGELARSGSTALDLVGAAVAADRAVVLERKESTRSRSQHELVLFQIDPTGKRITPAIRPDVPLPKIDTAQVVNDWLLVDTGGHVLMFHTPDREGP